MRLQFSYGNGYQTIVGDPGESDREWRFDNVPTGVRSVRVWNGVTASQATEVNVSATGDSKARLPMLPPVGLLLRGSQGRFHLKPSTQEGEEFLTGQHSRSLWAMVLGSFPWRLATTRAL